MRLLLLFLAIGASSLFAAGAVGGEVEKQPLNVAAIIMFLIFMAYRAQMSTRCCTSRVNEATCSVSFGR